MNRGYVIVAQNNSNTDYIQCARVLARSIRRVMPSESISLITDKSILDSTFDNVIVFPHQDQCSNVEWKLANDWQVYDSSPYEYTIKLEADMYIPRDISWWWDILEKRDLVICSTIRDYLGCISNNMHYRQYLTLNQLPNTYNAITYFRKSSTAQQFYELVKDIFQNWENYANIMTDRSHESATTDFIYSIAAMTVGITNTILPQFTDLSFVHMKSAINNLQHPDWTKELICEFTGEQAKIGCNTQLYPIHYHQKHFANILETEFGL